MKGRINLIRNPKFQLVAGLLILGIGLWYLIPSAARSVDFRNGVDTWGVLREDPRNCSRGCDVSFDAQGSRIVAELPPHSTLKMLEEGDPVQVRYQPGNPQKVMAQRDYGLAPVLLRTVLVLFSFVDALYRGADGLWPVESGIWLLDRHGVWLVSALLRNYVHGGLDEEGELWAALDIDRIDAAIDADEFGEWGEGIAVLCVAMSLCSTYSISLRLTCENMSEQNLALIGRALFRASGYT